MLTEEKIRKNFAQRLELACKEKGLPEKGRGKQIADILKITPKAVSKWFNAETMPSTSNIYVLADYLDVTPEWLTFGNQNLAPITIRKTYSYPLLSNIQAGIWTNSCVQSDSTGYEYLESEIYAGEEAFFLKISGQSMEPRFSEGDLVLIDTRKKPHPGDFVVAVNGTGEATFKQYKELGEYNKFGNPHFELIPLNTFFAKMSTKNQDIRIIGVVVEHRQYL